MKIGATDDFESRYMAKFRELAAPHGVFVEYAIDRAGRDIGLHLTQPLARTGSKILTPALIWFQMKGIMPRTMSLAKFKAADEVSVTLETAHLRFWYMNVQPTYLAVYVGSADCFLAIDLKDWVNRNYDDRILTYEKKTVSVKVHKKNVLDDQFFYSVLQRNLVPVLRSALAQDGDAEIARFLRDSSLVKWLAISARSGAQCRMSVVKWLSKMRTEVYFETRHGDGEWEPIRTHWQYAMGDIADAFPFLKFRPKRKAVEQQHIEMICWDDDEREYISTVIAFEEDEDSIGRGDDEVDHECLLALGGGEYSYGEAASGEAAWHEIFVSLNEVGERWARTLEVLEEAEIISVDTEPHWISVAPWHARDV